MVVSEAAVNRKTMFQAEVKSRIDEDICILIRPDNHPWNYLCDCGMAAGLSVKECHDTRAILISHTHFDHFANFDTIVRHQLGSGLEVVICGPQNIARQVQARLRSYTWNLAGPDAITYQIREIIDASTIRVFSLNPPEWVLRELPSLSGLPLFAEDGFQVDCTILDHKIPSVAYRFREADTVKIDIATSGYRGGKWVSELKAAFEQDQGARSIEIEGQVFRAADLFHLLFVKKGDSLGVIMDHAASPENHEKIRALFSGCRQVFIESFFREIDRELADVHRHSYAAASGRIMRQCGVVEAIPVHFSRKYEQTELDLLVAEFEAAYTDDA